jgi:hypothetical protein
MHPKKVVVLRHAEKPYWEGDQRLADVGYKRADYIAQYIPKNFGLPDWIYATAGTKASIRPILTVMPLMVHTTAMIDLTHMDDEAEQLGHNLVHEGHHAGQNVVVCWHHGKIPALMKGLGLQAGEYPEQWPDNDFGSIYVVTFEKHKTAVSKFQMQF